jgi:hypothetical protein
MLNDGHKGTMEMSTIACRLGRSHLEPAAGQGGSQKFLVQFIAPPAREGGSTLNTSFIERLSLTIRQGSAYLCRRTICHARWKERLEGHLELLRCYYNFVRPHRALKFGQALRTPAMQAGLTEKQLTLRQIFCSGIVLLALREIAFRLRLLRPPLFSVEYGGLQAA